MVPKLDTGVGGARKRWKLAKFTMAGILLTLGVTSLGTVANWQLVVSSRSIGNASLVIPISTLYASPEKISRDGFCAFQPNRPMRPSLPIPVDTAADAEALLDERVRGQVVEDRGVGDRLDESRAECRRGNPEDDVAVADLGLEVFLPDAATAGARVAGNHEQGVDAAVAGAVGIVLEARFSNGPVGRDERRKDVALELQIPRHAEQGIRSRARATDGGLHMAARAAHEVEARTDAVGDGLFLSEIRLPFVEHLSLFRGQAGQRTSRSVRASPNAGVAGSKDGREVPGRPEQEDGRHRDREQESVSRLAHVSFLLLARNARTRGLNERPAGAQARCQEGHQS